MGNHHKRGPLAIFAHPSFWFVVVLVLALVGLWKGLGFAEEERRRQVSDDEVVQRILDERGEVVGTDAEGPEQTPLVLGTRSEIIASIEAGATALLPDAQDATAIQRFWFSSDTEVYVEYLAYEEVQMAYLQTTDTGLAPAPDDVGLARSALYGQAESGSWELLDGEEVLFVKPLRDLYERDASGLWTLRN